VTVIKTRATSKFLMYEYVVILRSGSLNQVTYFSQI
jgi:hypothetical protein